jgi:hypothetical protein
VTATNPGSSFAEKAQSLVPALLVAAAIGMVWQMFSMNHAIGALEANTATLVEQGRDHGNLLSGQSNQLHDLDKRMTAMETQMRAITDQLKTLTEAVNRIAPK